MAANKSGEFSITIIDGTIEEYDQRIRRNELEMKAPRQALIGDHWLLTNSSIQILTNLLTTDLHSLFNGPNEL